MVRLLRRWIHAVVLSKGVYSRRRSFQSLRISEHNLRAAQLRLAAAEEAWQHALDRVALADARMRVAYAELRAEHFCTKDLARRLKLGEPAGVPTYASLEAVCDAREPTVLRAHLHRVGRAVSEEERARSTYLTAPDHDAVLSSTTAR